VIFTLAPCLFYEQNFLRKIKLSDKKYLAYWWRDKELLKLTSDLLRPIPDKEVNLYFQEIEL